MVDLRKGIVPSVKIFLNVLEQDTCFRRSFQKSACTNDRYLCEYYDLFQTKKNKLRGDIQPVEIFSFMLGIAFSNIFLASGVYNECLNFLDYYDLFVNQKKRTNYGQGTYQYCHKIGVRTRTSGLFGLLCMNPRLRIYALEIYSF